MTEGPLGVSRPLVKTRLKYDVLTVWPHETYFEEPKAKDVLDKRVNALQESVISNVEKQIGKTILAVNRLTHPNRAIVHNKEELNRNQSPWVKGEEVGIKWTYIIRAGGAGEARETLTTSDSMWKLHEVLSKGNNDPISNAQAIREFDPGPARIDRVEISSK